MSRVLKLSILIPIFIVAEILNYAGFIIDELIFPAYRNRVVKAPVFILGMPRSGTTFLHNLLSRDEKHYTTMKLWEILFAPSITQKKFIILISRIDARMNYLLRRLLVRFDRIIFREYTAIHPLSLFNVEEDEYLFFHIFNTSHLLFWFPSIRRLYRNLRFDQAFTKRSKLRQLRFYERCIKKHLFVFGTGRTYLAKSPLHTPKLESLSEFFPDAVFLYIIRKPHDVIPSTISLFEMFSRVFGTPAVSDRLKNRVMEIADHWYYYVLEKSITIGEGFHQIRFDELTQNPVMQVKRIYNKCGFKLTPEYIQILTEESAANKYISKHHYSLTKYGLIKSEIQKRYKPIYNEYFSKSDPQKTTLQVPVVTYR